MENKPTHKVTFVWSVILPPENSAVYHRIMATILEDFGPEDWESRSDEEKERILAIQLVTAATQGEDLEAGDVTLVDFEDMDVTRVLE
jgi:hypothetical protein